MTTVAIIPARGGSKRVPRKNLADLGGKPLLAWTIEAALQAQSIEHVYVSSEDREILDCAIVYGAQPLYRSPELAQDHIQAVDVIVELLPRFPGADIICMLQPTAPFRTAEHIDEAIGMLKNFCCSVVSIHDVHMPHGLLEDRGSNVCRLQGVCQSNGAIQCTYASKLKSFKSFFWGITTPYRMNSEDGLDIDTPADLERARQVLARRMSHGKV